jgi:glycosyltransferase involved in cell wall biosynthesis
MSKGKVPAVSVVMPVYNAAKYLPLAIESILNQTYKDFEFIIIDDGSTDESWEIIKKYSLKDGRIRIIRNRLNLGICRTLNYGISQARGKYIARMDGDDWSYPDRFFKQVSFMKAHPKVVICGGFTEVCDMHLNKIIYHQTYPTTDKMIRKKILILNPFAHPLTIYKKKTFLEAGGYNERLFTVEDYDLYFRLGNLGKFANLAYTLLKLRIRDDSISRRNIARQTALNLFVRLKGVAEYGYPWHFIDFVYFVIGLTGIITIPARYKFEMANIFRKTVK